MCCVNVLRDNGYTKVFERLITLDLDKEVLAFSTDPAIAFTGNNLSSSLLSSSSTSHEGALGTSWEILFHGDGTPELKKPAQ